jgi:hypothetical protein
LDKGNYQRADIETSKLWLNLYERDERDWLSAEEMKNLPIAILHQVDKLWSQYSNNHFGYTVQFQVLSSIIEKVQDTDFRTFFQLSTRLGWADQRSGFIYDYNKLDFSINAQPGHLPTTRFMNANIGGSWQTNWEQNCISLFKKINQFVKYIN